MLSQSDRISAKEQMFLIFGKMAPIQNQKGSDFSQWGNRFFFNRAAADVEFAASGCLVT